MTVLRALSTNYEQLLAAKAVPEFGYSHESISFGVVLSRSGKLLDVFDCRDSTNKTSQSLRNRLVPRPPHRTGRKVVPNFLWDRTDYAMGVTGIDTGGKPIYAQRAQFDAFRKFHLDLLAHSEDEGLIALRAFVESWSPEQFSALPHADEMAGTNVIFRLDGTCEYLHERPAAKSIWRNHLAAPEAERGLCLVTGERGPIARLHPKIKGVWGAHPSGSSIISFNLGAFESYGRAQGANAPVSERAAFAYTTALNAMLMPESRQKIRIGDTTTVFWAESAHHQTASAAVDLFAMALEPPTDAYESATMSESLAAIMKGLPLDKARPRVDERTRFFVLGLAPNASRLSVRFWHEATIGNFLRRIGEHWRDLWIEPSSWQHAPVAWRLLVETAARREGENIAPKLSGQLIRAMLTGARYPRSLLAAVIARMRADKIVNGTRVALCKACLARDYRLGFEQDDISMSLDREDNNPAYLLGRLFAFYEAVQKAALRRTGATIKDRYFGVAAATPAFVFPLLERNCTAHLALLRTLGDAELARSFDAEMGLIFERLNTMYPRSLRLEDQGRFAIGYHHQRGCEHLEIDAITNDRFED